MTAPQRAFEFDFVRESTASYLRLVPSDASLDEEEASSTTARDVSQRGRRGLEWLSKTYSLIAAKEIDTAVDVVLDRFDEMLHAGKFREADEALHAVDVKRIDSYVMVALMAITRPAKDRLHRREEVLRRIESKLNAEAPGRADELLAGLR